MKYYKVVITLSLVFCWSLCFSQSTKPNCSILKNCKLKYLDIEDTTAYVVISNKDHIEYHNNKRYYIMSKLNWLSDCEYNMTMTKITIPNFPFHPGEIMNVKFEKIEDGIVYFISTVRGHSFEGRFELMK